LTRRAWLLAPTRSPRGSAQRRRRRTYAAVYRSLIAFLGPYASAEDLTPEAVRAYRDALEHAGRTPATIAKHLSAVRGLATTVGAHADVRTVRSASVARGEPRALSHDEFARLLRMPDRRTRQGKRDLALLHLLGSAGLRRSEAAKPAELRHRRAPPRLRPTVAPGDQELDRLVGDRPLRQARAQPRRAARRRRPRCDRRVGHKPPGGRDRAPAALAATQRPARPAEHQRHRPDQSHADFASHANLSATFDEERRIIHTISPHPDPFWDSIWLWIAARQFLRVLAGVLKVHPNLDDADFLVIAGRVTAAEERVAAEIAERREA